MRNADKGSDCLLKEGTAYANVEIVDIGAGGPSYDKSSHLVKESRAVVFQKRGLRVDAKCARLADGASAGNGARAAAEAVLPIGCETGNNPFVVLQPIELQRCGQCKLGVAAAHP